MSDLRATNFRGRTSGSVPDFPDGVTVVSGISTLDSQGVRVAGIVTATSFSGDGSSLTSIASIVTGNTSVQTVDTGSDGHVKVNTEGIERIRVDSSGNLGVGTITPATSRRLHVADSTTAFSQWTTDATGSTHTDGTLVGVQADSSFQIWNYENSYFRVSTNNAERMRITGNGGLLLSNGILVEHCKIVTTEWNTTNDISLDDGNVFLNTSNLGGTGTTIDITSSNGLDTDLAVGDMTSVTLITAVNAATAFINAITIGAAGVTESWVGGSAPTDGGSSGYDVYTFNIIKTAATPTYVVIANQVKGS